MMDIVDGKEETIRCAECNKPLMHYKCCIPKAPIIHKITAKCPFCGGKSFEQTVDGDIYAGPIGKDESNYPTIMNESQVEESKDSSGNIIFKSIIDILKG